MNEIDREWLLDMLDYARKATRILGTADAKALAADERSFLALSYAVQVIGEAAGKVSPEGRAALPSISWQDAIAMRHRLVHGYRGRSAEIIVQTITDKLPDLIIALDSVVGQDINGAVELATKRDCGSRQ